MNISGSGRIPAGEFEDKISVSGSGRLDGNVRCISLSCSGSVHGAGWVKCSEDVRVSGSCHINGDLEASTISVRGALHVDGDLSAVNTVKVSGAIHCEGNARSSTMKCSGVLHVGKGIEAEDFHMSGVIKCGGLLNAEKVDISLDRMGNGSIGSIGGGEIRIYPRDSDKSQKPRLPLLAKLIGRSEGGGLTVEEGIEGDVIALENVKTPKVVGRMVAIGVGCDIDLVQYGEECEIHPDAKVGRCEKL